MPLPTPRGGTHRYPGTARRTGVPSAERRAPQPAATAPTHWRQKDWRLGAIPILFRHFILSSYRIGEERPLLWDTHSRPRPPALREGCVGAQTRSHPLKDTLTSAKQH